MTAKHITDQKWMISKSRVWADIFWVSEDGNDGGEVAKIRSDGYGQFPQAGVILHSPEMKKLLVDIFNENKCGHVLMGRISELLKNIDIQ